MSNPDNDTFQVAQDHIFTLMYHDCFPRFIKSKHYKQLLKRHWSRLSYTKEDFFTKLRGCYHFSTSNSGPGKDCVGWNSWPNVLAAKYHKFSDQLLIFFSSICNSLLLSLDSSCCWAGLFKARLGYTKISERFGFGSATFLASVSFRLLVFQFWVGIISDYANLNLNEKYFYARKILNILINF